MRRTRLPRVWLFTDERMGDALWSALARLPRGAGVIVRHHEAPDRAAFARRVRAAARARGLAVLVADDPRLARALRADGTHQSRAGVWPDPRGGRSAPGATKRALRTATAHSHPELVAAGRARAHLAFLAPVFATQTHPGARPLGRVRFARLARAARVPVAALGGMTPARYRSLRPLGACAWGAIDAHR